MCDNYYHIYPNSLKYKFLLLLRYLLDIVGLVFDLYYYKISKIPTVDPHAERVAWKQQPKKG